MIGLLCFVLAILASPFKSTTKMPGPDTVWSQDGEGTLTAGRPQCDGLEFRRTISVDDRYLFTLRDEVANHGAATVSLQQFSFWHSEALGGFSTR